LSLSISAIIKNCLHPTIPQNNHNPQTRGPLQLNQQTTLQMPTIQTLYRIILKYFPHISPSPKVLQRSIHGQLSSSVSDNSNPQLDLTFGHTFWPHFNTPSTKDFIMTEKTKALTTFENSLCQTPKSIGNASPKPIHLLSPSRRCSSPLAMALLFLPHTLHMTSN
jgi:hypothetical protein